MWVRDQAVANLPRSKPFGQRAIGVRSVSWVGVIDDLTIHSSGPSPTISRKTSVAPWMIRIAQRIRAAPPVGRRHDPAVAVGARAPRDARDRAGDASLMTRCSTTASARSSRR